MNHEHCLRSDLTADVLDTCVDPLSIEQLSDFGAESPDAASSSLTGLSTQLTYGSVLGDPELRRKIQSLYRNNVDDSSEPLPLVITQGGISANFLVLHTLLGAGDHVICQYPTYQQLFDVPRHAGADVSLWRSCAENAWVPDVTELPSLVRQNTKMIIIKCVLFVSFPLNRLVSNLEPPVPRITPLVP